MRVRWNNQAKIRLRQTANYIRKEFGPQAKVEFMDEVKRTNALLSLNPSLGPRERYLEDMPSKYRSVVVRKHNKIVYRVVDDHIEVVAFWDTRREPKNQAEQVK